MDGKERGWGGPEKIRGEGHNESLLLFCQHKEAHAACKQQECARLCDGGGLVKCAEGESGWRRQIPAGAGAREECPQSSVLATVEHLPLFALFLEHQRAEVSPSDASLAVFLFVPQNQQLHLTVSIKGGAGGGATLCRIFYLLRRSQRLLIMPLNSTHGGGKQAD